MNRYKASTSREAGLTKSRRAIIEEAHRLEENCLYSSKGHYAAAQYWNRFHIVSGLSIAILAAAVGTSAFAQLQPQSPFALLGGAVSFIVALGAAVSAFLKPNEKASTHHSCGNSFDSLLTRSRLFRTIDCWNNTPDEILTERLRLLCDERTRLKASSPQIPYRSYRKAKRGIEAGEAAYAVDSKSFNSPSAQPVQPDTTDAMIE